MRIYNEKLIRLQKYLSSCGIISRRGAETLIINKKISINGRCAKLGDKVDPGKDIIKIGETTVKIKIKKINYYIALYKPKGYVTSMKDKFSRKCIVDLIKDIKTRVYPIGRLDKESEGLLLLTNDGDFANLVMHPSSGVEKKYIVTVTPIINKKILDNFLSGVKVNKEKLSVKKAILINNNRVTNKSLLEITLTEGKNRHIRKMCNFFNLKVIKLKRISIGPVKLLKLGSGEYRHLHKKEIDELVSVKTKVVPKNKYFK